jgi:hypothetical protein
MPRAACVSVESESRCAPKRPPSTPGEDGRCRVPCVCAHMGLVRRSTTLWGGASACVVVATTKKRSAVPHLVQGGEGLDHAWLAWERRFGEVTMGEGLAGGDALLGVIREESHEQVEPCIGGGRKHPLAYRRRVGLSPWRAAQRWSGGQLAEQEEARKRAATVRTWVP